MAREGAASPYVLTITEDQMQGLFLKKAVPARINPNKYRKPRTA